MKETQNKMLNSLIELKKTLQIILTVILVFAIPAYLIAWHPEILTAIGLGGLAYGLVFVIALGLFLVPPLLLASGIIAFLIGIASKHHKTKSFCYFTLSILLFAASVDAFNLNHK